MYGIDSLWIMDIYCKLLDLVGRMVGKAWEGRKVPQGCICFGIVAEIWLIMKPLCISSHDIRNNEYMGREL